MTEAHPPHAQIVVQEPGTSPTPVPFRGRSLTIGRAQDNDIQLSDPGVSSHHARISYDEEGYQVIDLESTNGTYIGDDRLDPNESRAWREDQVVRLGPVVLRLQKESDAEAGAARTVRAAAGKTEVDSPEVPASEIETYVGVSEVPIKPGDRAVLPLAVRNKSEGARTLEIGIEGIPEEWVEVPAPVSLLAGEQTQVNVVIHPPSTIETGPGEHPFRVLITGEASSQVLASAEAKLSIAAVRGFAVQLAPQQIGANKPGEVRIENKGNVAQSFQVVWEDWSSDLRLDPGEARLEVPPGRVGVADFKPRPRKRGWFWGSEELPYGVRVTSDAGETKTLSGEVVNRGILLPVAIITAVVGCLLVVGVGVGIWNFLGGDTPGPTQTTEARMETVQAAVAATSSAEVPFETEEPQAEPTIPPPTLTPTEEVGTAWQPFPDCPETSIRVGNWTKVAEEPPLANRVRDAPGTEVGAVLGQAEPGTPLRVLDGPACEDGWIWWLVSVDDGSGLEGWTAEGPEGAWLVPGTLERP